MQAANRMFLQWEDRRRAGRSCMLLKASSPSANVPMRPKNANRSQVRRETRTGHQAGQNSLEGICFLAFAKTRHPAERCRGGRQKQACFRTGDRPSRSRRLAPDPLRHGIGRDVAVKRGERREDARSAESASAVAGGPRLAPRREGERRRHPAIARCRSRERYSTHRETRRTAP